MKITYEKPHTEVIYLHLHSLMDTTDKIISTSGHDKSHGAGDDQPTPPVGPDDGKAGAKGWNGGVTDFDAWDD